MMDINGYVSQFNKSSKENKLIGIGLIMIIVLFIALLISKLIWIIIIVSVIMIVYGLKQKRDNKAK